MTPYEDLCAAFRQSQSESATYRTRSLHFIGRLLSDFEHYLGAPDGRVTFLPPDVKDSQHVGTQTYNAMGAAKFGEDGWWAANVALRLSQGPRIFPEISILFQFRVLVEANRFTVRLGDSKQSHVIDDADASDAFSPIYEEAAGLAKTYFNEGLKRFIGDATKEGSRRIGFTADVTN